MFGRTKTLIDKKCASCLLEGLEHLLAKHQEKSRKIRYPPCFVVQSVSMFWFSPPAGITGLPAPL